MLERQGISYVVYERSAEDTPPRGECLDIHRSSGQDALKEAGCFEESRNMPVWDSQGNKLFTFGEGRDPPEIDRAQLKQTLLSVIPDGKVRWSTGVDSANRDGEGKIVLSLANGSNESGFNLVVGADGAWTKIRHLVTFSESKYSGMLLLTLFILPSNEFYPTLEEIAGQGPLMIPGR
ncbi:uncharacterized protein N7473_007630 [Penicillium subrubescens]|uniref:uncharacterized protein n=1 Tax=Penicillium subrubescens TaxID=1316194 RepID=UPI002545804B|nr:uncharacterized protein N7473_007630 [Penicillium subrubescens]KAJ5891402.1 hypothetical protein N7473_007630 [Penicillium subrubescens]